MHLRMVLSLALVALFSSTGVLLATGRGLRAATKTAARSVEDPISGEWEGLFEIGGGSATVTFKLKLDGDKVTGTVGSAHTGPGTISKGSWADDKLAFILDFEKHESIAVTGSLQDGQLSGEFRTEGMVGKWKAKKKAEPAAH